MLIEALFILIAVPALLLGIFIFSRPLQVFAIQKRFYELINWRIEPISMEKEIRNTRLMGLFLVVFVIAAGVYQFFLQKR
ncbi:MAG: hypothetical protein Q8Q08_05330 [Candidatus Omnitrophota bacterium]|nr:hypothetical protein [Candidatus Omnitrophota bacterium]MDZ4242350.1 hypothetical protein [Candidatus Omnitrophota bacterium]